MNTSCQTPHRILLSIIIVSYNTRDVLRECLRRVATHGSGIDPETIVVDNASTVGFAEMVRKEFREAVLIESKDNLGFDGGNNLGLQKAPGQYILLLNPRADSREKIRSSRRVISEIFRTLKSGGWGAAGR